MINPLKKVTLLTIAVASVFFIPPSSFGQETLTPPGPPAPTMLTLSQVEPRIPINSVPLTITNPGSYYLTTNLRSPASTNAITILVGDVTVDLNGYTLTGIATNLSSVTNGIFINNVTNVTIRNGFLSDFGNGINAPYAPSGQKNTLVTGVSVTDCQYSGIYLGNGFGTVVESCTVNNAGSYGIVSENVKSSMALNCGNTSISGNQVSDCEGDSTTGDGIDGYVILNCYGSSYGYLSTGTGIDSFGSAQNCQGYSSSGIGLAGSAVQNCEGFSEGNGDGVSATIANNSYGYSLTGIGLEAGTATGCQGNTDTGTGLSATIAADCYGSTASGTGLSATIANSSRGVNNVGSLSESVTNKYNMP